MAYISFLKQEDGCTFLPARTSHTYTTQAQSSHRRKQWYQVTEGEVVPQHKTDVLFRVRNDDLKENVSPTGLSRRSVCIELATGFPLWHVDTNIP